MKFDAHVLKQYQFDALAAAVAIGLLTAAGLLVGQTAGAHADARAAAARASAAASASDVTRRSLGALTTQIAATRREASKVQAEFHPASDLNRRMGRITDVAGRFRLAVDAVEPGSGVRARFWQVPIRMAGRGSYRDTVMFLHALHAEMPDVTAGAVDLVSAGNGLASFQIDLTWTSLPPEPAASFSGKVDAAVGGLR